MIGEALSFPVADADGRKLFARLTGSTLAAAIGFRIAGGLYPTAFAAVAAGLGLACLAVGVGTATSAVVAPRAALPGLRATCLTGLRSGAIAVAVLSLPAALLAWTALGAADPSGHRGPRTAGEPHAVVRDETA